MIAISYRREDSLPIAGRLYDRLQAKFGKKNVFMDFDSIPPGMDFREQIRQMIERSNVVIAIIGPHWLGEQPDSSRRIDNPADFVRLEIGYALEAGIPVIPLLINTTQMPKPEMLPPDIQELAFRHALPLDSGMDFHSHADRVIVGIGKATNAARIRRRLVTNSEQARASALRTSIVQTSPDSTRRRRYSKTIAWVGLSGVVAMLVIWYVAAGHREETGAKPKRHQTESGLLVDAKPPSITEAQAVITSVSQSLATPAPPRQEGSPTAIALSASPLVSASSTPNLPGDQSGKQKLTRVYVKKYGVSALLPTDVFPDAKKLSNSDQSFLQGNSWTGQTTLTFSSVREPLAKVYAECATEHSPQAPSKTVQYKVLKPTWFVVSGDLGPEADASLGFYTKGVKKDGVVVIMHFQWREDDFPFSEEMFTAMSRGFDGN